MTINRREFLAAGLAAAATRLRAQAPRRPDAAHRRNVLLIVADDHGYDLGCAGGKVRTPTLDALARDGVLFTDAYASVSSCSSSRATLYTGLYSHTNGMYGLAHDVHNFSLLDDVKTLPWMLKQAGYATALVGKLHVKPEAALAYDAWLEPERPLVRDVAAMGHAAGKWLREQGPRPFFLTVAYSDPHRAGDASNFGNTRDWPEVKRERYALVDVAIPSHLPDLPGVRADLAEYYEAVSRMDAGIGILLRELKDTGHADDTLVIYLSDNGRPFPGAKDNLYYEGIHLPLIVRAPGAAKRGLRNRAMVSWIDIAPTVLDWTGATPPKDYRYLPLPGRSILPLLGEADATGWDEVFATHSFHEIDQYYPTRSLRTRRYSYFLNLQPALEVPIASDVALSPAWKAITTTPGARLGKRTLDAFHHRPAEELYDLAADPDEVVNLAGKAEHAQTLADLRRRLDVWRTATHDPWQKGVTDPFGRAH
ncbi:MAG: sulfatase [Rudaea sp.]|uniref:sulfatase family protein n=1 Tax=unclassified Rudaea TaxID=2627037 RepID=UPI0010F8A8C3|nr:MULTISPECIES: sulfatase [unclassified Rudaea]MBN8884644.1 sulfatase [Rudaea sp.]